MVLIKPDEWHDIPDKLQTLVSPRVVVCGGKGVGKSTFIRFAIEALRGKFNSICRLEADCGQPDHTPPGVISLARWSGQKAKCEIVSQRFLGFVNPGSDPFAYVDLVAQVYGDYTGKHGDEPLFVNLHGWSTGTGVLTWDAVIRIVQPHFVIHIAAEGSDLTLTDRNAFLPTEYPIPSFELIKLCPIIITEEDKTHANDRRWKRFASHFRPDLRIKNEFKSSHPSEFFQYPFVKLLVLPRSDITVSFPRVSEVPSDLFRAIDLTLVGLCNSESGQLICLGFVVSVEDPSTVSVLIPPNIPKKIGQEINCIVRGEMNWSPRDRVSHEGKVTSTDFLPTNCPEGMPYFLANSLVAEVSKTASTRTDLKRRRLLKNSSI